MRVLLSIKPEFATKIFDGSKRYEYRRVIFKNREVKTAVVYVSHPIGKVIGEFEIGEIIHENTKDLWAKTGTQAGSTEKGFLEYFEDIGKGYAIEVKEPTKYPNSLSLETLNVARAPQSFMYLA